MKYAGLLAILTGSSPVFGAGHVIVQKDKRFSQESIVIAVGDSVVFRNADDTSHNVFSTTEGQTFNLGIQRAGTETPQVFQKPGEVEVRCAIHPKMKLKVVVK